MALVRDPSIYCDFNVTLNSADSETLIIYAAIGMSSSIAGLCGAVLQLKSTWKYRNRQRQNPSADPRIIFYLALSDLVACLGVMALAIVIVSQELNHNVMPEKDLKVLVFLIEVITVFSFLASYIWTFSYALDTCFQVYQIDCPMIVYGIISWLIPLHIILCYELIKEGSRCEIRESRIILSYIVVVFVMFGNPLLFAIIHKKIKKILRMSTSFTDEHRKAVRLFKRKFFQIVFVFTICWFPNLISVSYELARSKTPKFIEGDDNLFRKFFFGIEAFLNPLQGLLNYFVYRKAFRVDQAGNRHRTFLSNSHLSQPVWSPSTRPAQERNVHSSSIHIHRSGSDTDQTTMKYSLHATSDEKTSLLRPQSAPCSTSSLYVCKLLGE